jgi:hypothetical protein
MYILLILANNVQLIDLSRQFALMLFVQRPYIVLRMAHKLPKTVEIKGKNEVKKKHYYHTHKI